MLRTPVAASYVQAPVPAAWLLLGIGRAGNGTVATGRQNQGSIMKP
jgi:hypothetical protein